MKKKKVLVIEDEKILSDTLSASLEEAGLHVLRAFDGKEGLEMAFQHHPDLILLDIVMPVMDGWTMFHELRKKDEWGKKVPVIILSNLNADDNVQLSNITKLEPSYFLIKVDWKIADLVAKVKDRLNKKTED